MQRRAGGEQAGQRGIRQAGQGRVEIEQFLAVDRGSAALTVQDSGSAIPAALAATLFRAPAASASGLGIGLYHAARQAEAAGYRLALAENATGAVAFRLTPAPAPDATGAEAPTS